MTKQDKIDLSARVAIISGLVALIVAIVLLLNYWQMQQSDPIDSPAMKALVQQFADNPDNETLRNDIRNLDLLARKAYFTSRWQIHTGSLFLLISSIVLVLSLRIYFSLKSKIEQPLASSQNVMPERILSQKWMLAIAGVLVILALAAGYRSTDFFTLYDQQKRIADNQPKTEPEIEVVEIIEETEATPAVVQEVAKDEPVVKEEPTPSEMKPEEGPQVVETETQDKTEPKQKVEESKTASFPSLAELKKQHPSFRGALSQGTSYAKNIPTNWDVKTGENILWKVDIPIHGYNSPIVWGDKVLLAGGNKTTRMIYCYSTSDGSLFWQHEVKDVPGSPAKPPKTTDDTGLSAPSLHTDGQRIYGIFGTGDLVCLDMDGKRLWAKNMGKPNNHYGHSSSLISWQEKLFVQYDTNKGCKLYALNVQTGEVVWEVVRDSKISWASPILAEIDGAYQIILSANPNVDGYSLEDGSRLWSVKCMMGEVGPSPGYADGVIYAMNEYAVLVAINSADNYSILWEDDEYLPEVSSPALSNGLLFIATSYGVFACYDAKTGEKYWEYESPNGFYGSPMIAEGKVYTLDMQGIMYIMEVSKELNIVAKPEMGEATTTTPAFTNGRIFVRTNKKLYCIGAK